MQNKSDAQLLGEYAAQGSEPAFAEIVARHTDLVYSVACRQTGSPELAHEVAQMVFTDLARKARTLPREVLLTGWLYQAARFAAAKAVRGEQRRQAREQEALTMQHLVSNTGTESAPGWEQLAPVLDDAMGELTAPDRDAILLRYFQNQDFHAVALALGVSESAAQRRVSRAVERLREYLAKRGVTAGASGLVVLISANAVLTAPAGLSAAIAAAVAGITAATAGTATIITMSWLNAKSAAAILAAALIAGTGTYFVQEQKLARAETRQRELAEQHTQLAADRDAALAAAQAKNQEAERLRVDAADLARLRNEVTQLRLEVAAGKQRVALPAVLTAPKDLAKDVVWAGVASFNQADTALVLPFFAELTGLKLDLSPKAAAFPGKISFTNDHDLTRAEAIRSLETVLAEQAGYVITNDSVGHATVLFDSTLMNKPGK